MSENNTSLIRKLKRKGVLSSDRIEKALSIASRDKFVPDKYRKFSSADRPLPIGKGQTISQPSVVVQMTELLDPKEGEKVLEIGAGSGWQAAIISVLVGGEGHVYTMEMKNELINRAKKNLRNNGFDNVTVVAGDGSLGLEQHGKFDKIICTAACPQVPEEWVDQLKENGRIVVPVGNRNIQSLTVYEKNENELKEIKEKHGYRFVPLLGAKGFEESE